MNATHFGAERYGNRWYVLENLPHKNCGSDVKLSHFLFYKSMRCTSCHSTFYWNKRNRWSKTTFCPCCGKEICPFCMTDTCVKFTDFPYINTLLSCTFNPTLVLCDYEEYEFVRTLQRSILLTNADMFILSFVCIPLVPLLMLILPTCLTLYWILACDANESFSSDTYYRPSM